MKKILILFIAMFIVGCSASINENVKNKEIVELEHSKEVVDIDFKSINDVEWTQTLFSDTEYMYFDGCPSSKEIPNNFIYKINDKSPELFAYYGVFKGYDVFSWDDDNAFGYAVHGFSIDKFVFQSGSYHILYCIKHTEEKTSFFTISENGEVLYYNREVVVPFVDLYSTGTFDLQDVGYIYYARNTYLKENSSPYADDNDYTFEMTSRGQYKVKCPTVDLSRFNVSRAIYKDFIFQREIPFYNYSFAFPKSLDKYLKECAFSYDKNSIYLANINGYDIFKTDSLDASKVASINVIASNLKDFVARRYLDDLNIINVYGFKDGKIYQLYDLLLNNVFGINILDVIACQIYTNLFDVRNVENDGRFDFKQDFYNRWKEHYLSTPSL